MATRPVTAGSGSPASSWALVIVGVLFGVVLCLLHLPGVAALAVAVAVAARMHPSPVLSGKPDASTRMPTPASPYEEQLVANHQRWQAAGRAAVLPGSHWVPGRDPHLSWIAGVGAALAAGMIPAAHLSVSLLNAAAAFCLAAGVSAALREVGRGGVPQPGSRWSDLVRLGRRTARIPEALGAVTAALAAAVLVFVADPNLADPLAAHPVNRLLAAGYRWLMSTFPMIPEWMLPPVGAATSIWRLAGWFVGASMAGAAVGAALRLRSQTLAGWQTLVDGRREWRPRWEEVKAASANPPELIDRRRVGRAQVDLFSCSASLPAEQVIRLAGTIGPTVNPTGGVMLLHALNVDAIGQEVPLTRHPTRFRVVSWDAGVLPPVSPWVGDDEEARLILECGMQVGCPVQPAPLLDDMVRISTASGRDEADTNGDGTVSLKERVLAWLHPAPPAELEPWPVAWATTWVGQPGNKLRFTIAGALAETLGCEVIGDHRAAGKRGVLYVGDLATELDATLSSLHASEDATRVRDAARGNAEDKHDAMVTVLQNLATESTWLDAWQQSLKLNANLPTINHDQTRRHTLADGNEIVVTPFVFRTGQSMADYAQPEIEAKLATALTAKPFVNVTGFLGQGSRPGERHPQAIRVAVASRPVPLPQRLAPVRGDVGGAMEVLSGQVNRAFTDAKLARPEVFRVRCVTKPTARAHIWSIQARLYGGVTLDEVRRKADKLRGSMGCDWLRVTEDTYGCRIVAGADPNRLGDGDLSKPDRIDLVGLDWEQAWIDGGVISMSGLTPKVVDQSVLPDNELVQKIIVEIPPGLSFMQLRMARPKLEASTQNGFIDIRNAKQQGAGFAELLVAKESPLRFPEPYRWELEPRPDLVPFATGIEGAPVELVLKDMAHLLVVGVTGGGKTAAAQALLSGALLSGADCAIVDAQKYAADYTFARDYCNGWATSVLQAAALMEALYAEVKRRAEVNGRCGVGSVLDLPEDVRPRQQFVFADEFFGLIAAGERPSPKPESDAEMEAQRVAQLSDFNARRRIAYLTGRIAAEARSAGFHLVLMTQKLTRDMIPSSLADLKANLNRIGLGKMGAGDKMSAFREPDRVPELGADIPPGRGIFEPVSGEPRIVQFWYAPQSELSDHLAAGLEPVGDRAIDLAPFQVDTKATGSFTVVDDDTQFDVVDEDDGAPTDPGPLDLGVVDLGLVFDVGTGADEPSQPDDGDKMVPPSADEMVDTVPDAPAAEGDLSALDGYLPPPPVPAPIRVDDFGPRPRRILMARRGRDDR